MALCQDLQTVVERLPQPPDDGAPRDAYGQVLWENIGYLVDDDRRRRLLAEFDARIGRAPEAILGAAEADLLDIAGRGGMRPETRIERWRRIADITLGPGHGDLDGTLRALPLAKARALLKLYPVIGDPGADKILLLAGISPRPALESNGVRALVRLGFVEDGPAYVKAWRAAIAVLAEQGRLEFDWLSQAYLALRAHGRDRCKRGTPLCGRCPLDPICAHAQASH